MGLFSFLFGGGARSKQASRSDPRPEQKAPTQQETDMPHIHWRTGSYPMDVVGESYYQDALTAICGPHSRTGHEQEYLAELRRDPSNRYDSNAVGVWIMGRKVGHLGRDQAGRVSEQMDAASLAVVACDAQVRGGWRTNQYDEGQFGVRLAVPTMGWIDLGIGADKPEPPARSPRPSSETRIIAPAASGPLQGEKIALQGATTTSDVAMELATAGGQIMTGPGKTTTLFVVNESKPFSIGIINSSNHRKALEMSIPILSIDEVRSRIAEAG